MTGYGAVRGLVLEIAVRAYENACHHGKRAEGGGNHIAHNIAVIVLACPDETAFAADDTGNGVINQRVEIGNSESLETLLVFCIVDFLEDILETVVVFFTDRILCGEPKVLLYGKRIFKAASCKRLDRGILVVHALQYAGALEIVDGFAHLGAVLTGEDKLGFSFAGDTEFGVLINIAVSMTGNRNRLLPGTYVGLDRVNHDRGTEDGAVKHGTNRSVRALPHLAQAVLSHALRIWRDRGTFYGNAVFLGRIACVPGNLVLSLFAFRQPEIVVLRLQIYKRKNQFVFDHLPENAGHFVAVHLDEGSGHLNLAHGNLLCGFAALLLENAMHSYAVRHNS